MPRLSKIGAAALAAFGWTGLSSVSASYLVVAGGGGGGTNNSAGDGGCGGGGAGGYRTGTEALNPTQSYSVIVGAGGASGAPDAAGSNGSSSVFLTTTSAGGGGGGDSQNGVKRAGDGGSGGGAGYINSAAGSGNTPSTSPSQGNNGGSYSSGDHGAGGGGATAAGSNTAGSPGAGGAGTANSISGSSVTYAGGGGGGGYNTTGASGGSGGGGQGGSNGAAGISGTANLGGGGGGGGGGSSPPTVGGNGGAGVVIISYVGAQQFGGGVVTSSGGNTIHTFTTSGTLSPLSSLTASALVVAGGSGGGVGSGGGGGAGGFRTGSGITIDTNSIYVVTVGAGGASGTSSSGGGNGDGGSGSDSVFLSITSTAGGYGAGGQLSDRTGGNGGSGGGGAGNANGGTGTSGQGSNGGTGNGGSGGGGGGAGATGGNATSTVGGNGGNGTASSISGSSVTYAGGGGGAGSSSGGTGGSGGGGAGGPGVDPAGNGTANTGGGGGGRRGSSASGSGGSGIVIISYAGSTQLMAGGTVTVAGGNVIHTFTSSGYLTPIVLVTNSLRFRQSASAFLSRTPTTAGNIQRFTLSVWYKPGNIGTSFTNANFISAGGDGSNIIIAGSGAFGSTVDNRLVVRESNAAYQFYWPMVFRDPAAWYHIVLAVDTTQATSSNRAKLYVNGVDQGTFSGTGYALNATTSFNSVTTHYIGAFNSSFYYTSCYFADYTWIDGQQLTANSFGTSNGLGVWQPIRYGGSYGTNGFYLPFNGSSNSTFAGSFNGSNQSLSVPTSSQFSFSGDFTWEAWVLLNVVPSSGGAASIITSRGAVASDSAFQFLITDTSGNKGFGLTISIGSTDYNCFTNGPLPITAGVWNHYAVVRSGTTVTRYLNGISVGVTTGVSGTTNTPTYVPTIGVRGSGGYNDLYLNGYISNLRMVGSAVYTANFTPPTSALTAISGTRLLTLQNSSIVDNSTNAFTITNNNSVTTSVQYPYVVTAFLDQGPAGNNWTPNNFSGINGSNYDFMTDVPTLTSATTANYCVMNPLNSYSSITVSNANLTLTLTEAAYRKSVATMAFPTTGKYYVEAKLSGINYVSYGIVTPTAPLSDAVGQTATGYGVITGTAQWDRKNNGSTSGNFWTFSAGTSATLQIAVDTTSGKLWLGYDNIWLDSSGGVTGNPSAGTNETFTIDTTRSYLPSFGGYKLDSIVINTNYGQQPFAYTPPTNFVALNTFNLPTPTIGATASTTANKYFDATTYTGNGATGQTIVNSGGFQPNFVWAKSRSNAYDHGLQDIVRGATKDLNSNNTDAEETRASSITAFASNGFTVGNDVIYNGSGSTYVGWQWAGGGAAVTNTAGSINSLVSANTTAGFSIVTYTGNGTNGATIGHGLGVAPRMIIVKERGNANIWAVGGSNLTSWAYYLRLNATNAESNADNAWNSTAPSSSVFTVGDITGVNRSSGTYVAYCFAQVAGYSAFGSYTGNGSTDGTFVYLGFRPRYLMIKRTDSSNNWVIQDTSRDTYNVSEKDLYADTAGAEATYAAEKTDILSNGFKQRQTGASMNASGGTYIYMAFAENPFKYSNAR